MAKEEKKPKMPRDPIIEGIPSPKNPMIRTNLGYEDINDIRLTHSYRQRILRWKFIQSLYDIAYDFDELERQKIPVENERFFDWLCNKRLTQDKIVDKKGELLWGLEDTPLWRKLSGEMPQKIEQWKVEYDNYLNEKCSDDGLL